MLDKTVVIGYWHLINESYYFTSLSTSTKTSPNLGFTKGLQLLRGRLGGEVWQRSFCNEMKGFDYVEK